jgi:nucleotide-binding universal stress UspA family protein
MKAIMKFDHILFPTDFSDNSRALTKEVEWLANRFGSRVTLLHVFEIPASWYGACEASFMNVGCFETIKESATQRLREYPINLPETRIERVVAEGEPAFQIANWAQEHAVDLIVMGKHGYGKVRGLLMGSVTAKVMHDVSCLVWTNSLASLKEKRQDGRISSIVCAIELTTEAVPLLTFAKELARELDATVQVANSVPEMESRPDKYFDFDLHRYLTDSARVEIAKLQRQAGTDFPLSVSEKPIARAIADAAVANSADLIVIGRGKSQETFGRLRTHAYDIIRQAPCPVLSFALTQPARTFSSCSEARHDQYATGAQPLIGCQTL